MLQNQPSDSAQSTHNTPTRGHAAPHSRTKAFAPIDQRTKEAKLLRETRATLLAHLGGKASPVQTALIERACQLTLHLAAMDRRYAETGAMSEHSAREYLAWNNTLTRTLARLGLKGVAERPPTLTDLFPGRAA